jgi:hypothetical protein
MAVVIRSFRVVIIVVVVSNRVYKRINVRHKGIHRPRRCCGGHVGSRVSLAGGHGSADRRGCLGGVRRRGSTRRALLLGNIVDDVLPL